MGDISGGLSSLFHQGYVSVKLRSYRAGGSSETFLLLHLLGYEQSCLDSFLLGQEKMCLYSNIYILIFPLISRGIVKAQGLHCSSSLKASVCLL